MSGRVLDLIGVDLDRWSHQVWVVVVFATSPLMSRGGGRPDGPSTMLLPLIQLLIVLKPLSPIMLVRMFSLYRCVA